jgi:hydroxyacylglutathione hydrolase
MIHLREIPTPELGDRSYLLHDGTVAAVIDPQRDIDRILAVAEEAGVRIACVAETHIHNDYLSGGWLLSQKLQTPYLVAAEERVSFVRVAVRAGDEFVVGNAFSLRVLATPGHTPHHVSYVALEAGRPVVVCTGGSMLFGSAGRTDLTGEDQAVPLAHAQYHSLHELGRLPDWVAVLPTHGFGSFCSAGASPSTTSSTIAQQRLENLAFQMADEESFVARLLEGFTAYPSYYGHMAARNRRGTPEIDSSALSQFDVPALESAMCSGAWIVDTRGRAEFAPAHLRGTINVEYCLQFSTYLGWLLPEDADLVLLGDDEATVSVARRDLSRIGVDRPAGSYVGPLSLVALGVPGTSYDVRGFADLAVATRKSGNVALDVRRADEWAAGHLEGAVHLPLHQLVQHMSELPPGTLWVHCAAGFRAGIAASLLQRHGRDVVLVDDNFATARDARLGRFVTSAEQSTPTRAAAA